MLGVCPTHMDWLPYVTCAFSVLLTLFSIPLNGILLVAIMKNKKFHTNFHFIIFNTTFADFLVGTILCPLSIAIHAREIADKPLNSIIEKIFHFALFSLAMVSVLSITVLSVDRMISLKFSAHYRIMKKRNFLAGLISVWVLATSLSCIYFFISYALFLLIISVTAVLVTALMMFVTYMLYRAQLRRAFIKSHSTSKDAAEEKEDVFDNPDGIGQVTSASHSIITKPSSLPMSLKRKFTRPKKDSVTSITSTQKLDEDYQVYLMEKRATNTFFYIMLVFFLCYVPLVALTLTLNLYPNISERCDVSILLLECIVILCIISSVCKTIVFIARLTALRKACINLFISDEEMERRWRKESVPMATKKKKLSLKDRLLRRKKQAEEESNELFA